MLTNFSGTYSDKWGPPHIAAARASLEPSVTTANEDLIRTYHRSLSCQGVWTYEEGSKEIWVVAPRIVDVQETHTAGHEIHFLPDSNNPRTTHEATIGSLHNNPMPQDLKPHDIDGRAVAMAYPWVTFQPLLQEQKGRTLSQQASAATNLQHFMIFKPLYIATGYSNTIISERRRTPQAIPRSRGAFLLPQEIRDSEILSEVPGETTAPGTFPNRQRNSRELRRSFSSHE